MMCFYKMLQIVFNSDWYLVDNNFIVRKLSIAACESCGGFFPAQNITIPLVFSFCPRMKVLHLPIAVHLLLLHLVHSILRVTFLVFLTLFF